VNNSRLVYSSDSGRIETPKQPAKKAPGSKPSVPNDGFVRIFREKGSRGGKTVTVIRGLPERGGALDSLGQELRRFCGAGGTVREEAIEIQGDHRERLAAALRDRGYKVKLAGG
jgi:predicted translation initiation factor SUI1